MVLAEIVLWLEATETLLQQGSTIAGIQQTTERLPAAFADYDGPECVGRVCATVNGEFDFEIIRCEDGELVFFRHGEAEQILDPELQEAFAAFARALAETNAN